MIIIAIHSEKKRSKREESGDEGTRKFRGKEDKTKGYLSKYLFINFNVEFY
jgi:hypothetical protein